VFASFEVDGHFTRGLCIVQDNCQYLEIHLPSVGECSTLAIPAFNSNTSGGGIGINEYQSPSLWPLDVGVSLSFDIPVASLGEGRVPQLPLYTVTSPLDEPRPVFESGSIDHNADNQAPVETVNLNSNHHHQVPPSSVGSSSTPFTSSPQSPYHGVGGNKNHVNKASVFGHWKVVHVERKNEWPMAIVVAVDTCSGRRAVWSLRRMMKEGIEGGRYAARHHAHRRDKQGWRSGALTGDSGHDLESSMIAEVNNIS
jgi:hypothetical protein